MLPDPLHPAIVHMPLALAALLPLAAAAALFFGRKERGACPCWTAVLVLAGLLSASAWVATETGEDQGEIVESVVAEHVIEEHEEAGEWVFRASLAVLAVAAVGLLRSRAGEIARWAALAGSLVLLGLAVRAGHSGGELVYVHGAARVYTAKSAVSGSVAPPAEPRAGDGDDDED